jgi:tRNA pseudouridine55 synthase
LLPLDSALSSLPDVHLSDESAYLISCGQSVRLPNTPGEGLVRLYRPGREFIGVGAVLADGRVTLRRLIR